MAALHIIVFVALFWLAPSQGHGSTLPRQELATVKIESTVTEFSARKRHRHRHVRRQVVEEFRFPWDEVENQPERVRVSHNRQAHKQRYRRGYVQQATFGGDLVAIARSQIGNGAIYGRARLWCARFMNYVVQRAGFRGTGSDAARSFAKFGTRVSGPQVGAIAVMTRRGGEHVGVVSGVDAKGNPIIISGNHGRRVAESVYSASRVVTYVVPN